jgi:hypothetical protein
MRSRVVLVLVCSIVAIALAACVPSGSANPNAPAPKPAASAAAQTAAPKPLELVETGYTVVSGPYVEYGFVLRNPNADYGAESPVVRITALDAKGGVLGTEDQTLFQVYPGQTLAFGSQVDPNGKKPAKVTFEVIPPGDNWEPADQMEPAGFKPFQITGLKANKSDFQTAFTGMLTNPNSTAFDTVAVTVLLRDKHGKIKIGYTAFPDHVAAGGKVPFEVTSMGDVPKYAKFEAYAQPWQ